MKAYHGLPSGTYNILLEKDDLVELLKNGHIHAHISKDIPCSTSRTVWDSENSKMLSKDEKSICNDLRFYLHEPVDDIDPGLHFVQFLSIKIDGDVLAEIKNDEVKE